MKRECTELFLRYREIARIIWNLGFWPNPNLREWDCVEVYREAIARLFEGMIVHAIGYQGRIDHRGSPGEIADFRVTANRSNVRLEVDKNSPEDPGHIWGNPVLLISSESQTYQLKFVRFFDWYELGNRDFRFLEVLIDRLDEKPELVGHHALIELVDCSIWFIEGDNDHPKEESPVLLAEPN
jgi:hypothetical protein